MVSLKILFQPAEELGSGATSMIKGGAIDDVEYIFGAHVRPFEEAENGQASPPFIMHPPAVWLLPFMVNPPMVHVRI